MNVASDWFIAPRVRRLQRLVHLLPPRSPGIASNRLSIELRPHLDGPREEIPHLVHVLSQLGLLYFDSDRYSLSSRGRRAKTLSEDRAQRELAELLIQTGFLHDQVRQLIEASTVGQDGVAQSSVAQLRRSAPQLLGLLRVWPNVVGPSFVNIPPELFALIDTPWSLVPSPVPDQGTLGAVGHRAEAYSFHLLRRESNQPTSVVWVARDDQTLGYDIEDRSAEEVHRVEVKGSQGSAVRFYLSAHEHEVAHQYPSSYAIHFWGEIDVNRIPQMEFNALRQRGFPLRFEDLASHLADRRLDAVPTNYRVTLGPGVRSVHDSSVKEENALGEGESSAKGG